jgi:hypothetical protein
MDRAEYQGVGDGIYRNDSVYFAFSYLKDSKCTVASKP